MIIEIMVVKNIWNFLFLEYAEKYKNKKKMTARKYCKYEAKKIIKASKSRDLPAKLLRK